MSDSNHRDDVEEFRRRLMENSITDPDEILAIMLKHAVPVAYVLELIYDEVSKTIILQGNEAGLNQLIETVKRLAHPEAVAGAHAHFDLASNMTRSDIHLIVQRVADDGSGGAHGIVKNNDQPE